MTRQQMAGASLPTQEAGTSEDQNNQPVIRRMPTCSHVLDDADAEVLVLHRVQAAHRAGQQLPQLVVAHVDVPASVHDWQDEIQCTKEAVRAMIRGSSKDLLG